MTKKKWVGPRLKTVVNSQPVEMLTCTGGFICNGPRCALNACLPGPDETVACDVCNNTSSD